MPLIVRELGGLVLAIIVIAVVFFEEPIASRLGERGNIRLVQVLRRFCIYVWAVFAWATLSLLTHWAIFSIFDWPIEGSIWTPAGLTILGVWGALIAWVAWGKRDQEDGDPPSSTIDGRIKILIDRIFILIDWIFPLVKWAMIFGVGLVVLVVGYVFLSEIESNIATMAPSSAILVGAVIIALAIASTQRR
jgi:hypothetical protein